MVTQDSLAIDTLDEAANLQNVAQRQANKIVTISSSELLEITCTRTGMEVRERLYTLVLYLKLWVPPSIFMCFTVICLP